MPSKKTLSRAGTSKKSCEIMSDTPHSQVLVHEEGRKATWSELFFDLVFVVAVAALAGALSHHDDGSVAQIL